jgi:hypothetical protein
MANSTPYEVIAAPFTVWIGAVGVVFPAVDEAPDSEDWTKLGTSGPLNYDDQTGVVVEPSQTTVPWRALGDAGSRKIFRTEEDFKVRLKLVDCSLEHYRRAVNDNAITTVAAASGVPGTKKIGLSRGFDVATMALLVRGDVSPYMANGVMQYEVPIVAQIGSPTVIFKKGEPAALDLEWMAMVDPSQSAAEYFGRLICQTAVALA